jgi:hypothetical protein
MLTASRKAQPSDEPLPAETSSPIPLNDETAGKLLAVLAGEKVNDKS